MKAELKNSLNSEEDILHYIQIVCSLCSYRNKVCVFKILFLFIFLTREKSLHMLQKKSWKEMCQNTQPDVIKHY